MTELRHINITGQEAEFNTGTPDSVDISGSTALTGMRTFAAAASADSWNDGDTLGILIKKDNSNYQIWIASWDSSNSQLLKVKQEISAGTISNGDAVEVTAIVSRESFLTETRQLRFEFLSDTDRTLTPEDSGKTFFFVNTMGAKYFYIPDDLPIGFWFRGVQKSIDGMMVSFTGSDDWHYQVLDPPQWSYTKDNNVVFKRDSADWDFYPIFVASGS